MKKISFWTTAAAAAFIAGQVHAAAAKTTPIANCADLYKKTEFKAEDQSDVVDLDTAKPCVVKAEGQPEVYYAPTLDKGIAKMVRVEGPQVRAKNAEFEQAVSKYLDAQVTAARERKARVAKALRESRSLTGAELPATEAVRPVVKAAKRHPAPLQRSSMDRPLYGHAPRDPVEAGLQIAAAPVIVAGRVVGGIGDGLNTASRQVYARPAQNPVELIGQVIFAPLAFIGAIASPVGNSVGYATSVPERRQTRRQVQADRMAAERRWMDRASGGY